MLWSGSPRLHEATQALFPRLKMDRLFFTRRVFRARWRAHCLWRRRPHGFVFASSLASTPRSCPMTLAEAKVVQRKTFA